MIFGSLEQIEPSIQWARDALMQARCAYCKKQKAKKHWHKESITHCQSLVWSLCAAYLITSAFNQLSNWGVRSYLHWLSLSCPSSGAPCLHSRSRTQYNKCKVLYVRVCACSGGEEVKYLPSGDSNVTRAGQCSCWTTCRLVRAGEALQRTNKS